MVIGQNSARNDGRWKAVRGCRYDGKVIARAILV